MKSIRLRKVDSNKLIRIGRVRHERLVDVVRTIHGAADGGAPAGRAFPHFDCNLLESKRKKIVLKNQNIPQLLVL